MFASAPSPELRRRRLVGLVVGLALAGLLAGTYIVLSSARHGSDGSAPPSSSDPRSAAIASSDDSAHVTGDWSLNGISGAEAFAAAVAHALFDWNTAAPVALSAHVDRILAVAEPTSAEPQGLIADVSAYLPTEQAWAYLKQYYTRQWIEIDSIAVPDLWNQAVEEVGPEGFAPGTTAYSIEGVRHRTGVWEGDDVSSAHEVAFTVFMVCAPSYPSCHLLRLSRLDEPLD